MIKAEILLLTAGKSSRMGQPKALLSIKGQPLISYQIDRLKELGLPITIVLGAYADAISNSAISKEVRLILNKDFEKGMGSSIAFGTTSIRNANPEIDAILVCAIDQPLIPLDHFENLLSTASKTDFSIIQSLSEVGWKGIPTLFKSNHFKALSKLTGDEGAKSIIQNNLSMVKAVKAPSDSLIDIDTYEQYQNLNLD
ncbi:MAG: Nicotine blue oxidoreductase [Flavobacteriaceae bacterium]|jgi:molybdenum cofactor cytidylyltransferase|nr:nucleotidyltransferase family protein [Flavobacteriaceae bacterium]CAI8196092.1 MAG: Nicotine blue oxidoreductase [Flavobacteriaceae bacterium]